MSFAAGSHCCWLFSRAITSRGCACFRNRPEFDFGATLFRALSAVCRPIGITTQLALGVQKNYHIGIAMPQTKRGGLFTRPVLEWTTMRKRVSIVTAAGIVLWLGVVGLVEAQQEDEGPMSELQFVVVKDYNGKPIRNAAVVLHPVNKKGKQAKGGLELKTDNDGRTNIDGIPYGPLRVQVLAPGFQTFGEDYQIDKPELQITVKLKRPGGQYSQYGSNGETKKADDAKPPEPKPQ
jgi:hypothetical protein